ncbi:unnamed protein product [Parnassius apollo]|uniref:(apollo) hypothetical protein n=1 Tax=Parnassius apollo TaxID=110799 RepID=A0A8S3WH72_PARAO|nr:unnamed protein product [Parnassius apollo]
MYRLIAILLFVNLASCHWHHEHNHGCGEHGHWRHSWHHRHNDDNYFERLAQCVISADNLLKTSCAQTQEEGIETFKDLRILPGSVKTTDAKWSDDQITCKNRYAERGKTITDSLFFRMA